MSIISNFTYYIKNDPEYRKKFLMYSVIVVILLVIGGVLLYLNTSLFGNNKVPNQSMIPGLESELTTIDKSDKIEKFSQTQASIFQQNVGFTKDNKLVYLDNNNKISIDNNTYSPADGTTVIPNSVFYAGSNLIINSDAGVYKYQNNEIKKFDDSIKYVTPSYVGSNVKEYYYLQENEYALELKSATNIELNSGEETIGEITKSNVQTLEVRVLNGNPYIFMYDKQSYLETKLSIYDFDKEGKIRLNRTISKLDSIAFSNNAILVTVSDSTSSGIINTYLINYQNNITTYIDTQNFLKEKEISGIMTSSRCVIKETDEKVICAVKKDQKISADLDNRDILIEYNYKQNLSGDRISVLYPGIIFMAKDIYLDNGNNLYMIYQRDGYIYKFK